MATTEAPVHAATLSPRSGPAQYLTFRIGGDEYAVGILRVREILEYRPITRVPTMPPWIRGVLNLRGSVVPVVDLAVKLGLPAVEVTRRTCIVIVEAAEAAATAGAAQGLEATVMGIVVDSVRQVVELLPGDIEPPPGFGTPVRVEFLLGLGKLGDGFTLLLDLDRVLSAEELLRVQEAPSAAVETIEEVKEAEEQAGGGWEALEAGEAVR
jgi:purine-binding chemotaxis protein CheW